MEDLNKNQIVLLCILISFIVSIATGIMTTALLQQAPVELTRTVNRVVEKTIQSITPTPTITNPNPGSTQMQTVVVSVDDSVTNAVAKNIQSVVRIRGVSSDGTVDNFMGLGIVVSPEGIIVADKQNISAAMVYTATMYDGTKILLVPINIGGTITGGELNNQISNQVSFFKAKPIKPYTFTVANLATNDLKLGQTVVAIGGTVTNAVSVGRVVSLNTKDITSIETDVSPADSVAGAPILSLSGDVVGMSLSAYSSSKIYLPSVIIKKALAQIQVVK